VELGLTARTLSGPRGWDGLPVRGPIWRGAPLPGAGAPAIAAPESPAAADGSSEIPDSRRLELSRLANPKTELRPRSPSSPGGGNAVSAEQPLSLRLSVSRPAKSAASGDIATLRAEASADCHAIVIAVDAAGRAALLFRTPVPLRSFVVPLSLGEADGVLYVVALVSIQPAPGPDAAGWLRGLPGFASSASSSAAAGVTPAAAWEAAIRLAAELSAPARKWQRYEWAAATAMVEAPASGALGPSEAGKGARARAAEGSRLPGN
jgi:hypothetical protein